MNQKTTVLILLLFIVLVFVVGKLVYDSIKDDYTPFYTQSDESRDTGSVSKSDENNKSEQENTAPDFSVLDYEGNIVSLSDFYGKPIIINFWASWCGPCRGEMPVFEELYKEFGEEVVFMMINLTDGKSETVSSVKEFITDEGYTFPVYFDTEDSASTAYSINPIPHTFVINKNGNVETHFIGALNENTLRAIIDLIR